MPSNLERKARRKRQTRLTFDPVDLSSSSVRRAPAKVRYEHPRKVQTPASSLVELADDTGSDDILNSTEKHDLSLANSPDKERASFKPLPTPATSSHVKPDPLSSDLDELEGGTKHITRHTQQARKPWNISGSSLTKVGTKIRNTGFDGADDSSDGSLSEDEIITSSKKSYAKRSSTKAPVILNLDSDSEEQPLSNKAILAGKKSRGKSSTEARRQESITLSELSDGSDELPTRKGTTKSKGLFSRASKSQSSPTAGPSKSRPREGIVIDDSDDDISLPTKSFQRAVVKDEDEDSEPVRSSLSKHSTRHTVDDEESDSDPISSPLKRQIRTIVSDDSDVVSSPLKRRRNTVEEEEDDSDSDLLSLNKRAARQKSASKTPPRITRQQRKTRKPRSKKEKTLELLKRKRAGEDIEQLLESVDEEDDDEGDQDSEDQLEVLSQFDDEEESPEQVHKTSKVEKTSAQDSDDSAFIVEDDDDPLGIPDHTHLIPLEFTHASHKPLKEHFKDAVEWMIHNKINPAFNRNDPIYTQAFQKLDDLCYGLAKSKFTSSQWTDSFTKALYARPQMEAGTLGQSEELLTKCEACNRGGHPPSGTVQFVGKAYHRDTLEEVDQGSDDSDEDDDSDSSVASINAEGQEIPGEDKIWSVGRFCKANAEHSHTLIHWKYALNGWVMDELERREELIPSKLAEREKMKAKQRTRSANALVDSWEEQGEIKALYKTWKAQLNIARELTENSRGGWK